jgi:integrase
MFNLAPEWDWRPDNPAKGIRAPRITGKADDPKAIGRASVLRSVRSDHPNVRAANAVRLRLLTGARLGEVLTSRKGDFDLHRGVWTKPSHQTKQKRTEHLPVSALALALVVSIIEASDPNSPFLFSSNKPGQPFREIKKFWISALRQARIANYRRHDNQPTYASHLVSSGLGLEIVGRLLGHTTATTTKRHAHLADDPLRAATDQFERGFEPGQRAGRPWPPRVRWTRIVRRRERSLKRYGSGVRQFEGRPKAWQLGCQGVSEPM